MNYRVPQGSFIFALSFSLALAAAGYFALQLRSPGPARFANYLAADKGYGVTIDLTQYDEVALIETLQSLRESNLVWLRLPLAWAEIEPAPGEFDWTGLDRVLAAVKRQNETAAADDQKFKLIAVLHTTPAWARPADTPPTTPPVEISHFGRFAQALAARSGQDIDLYQIWHEPNLSANWGQSFVEPAAYAGLLREAALNIRAGDSTAYILTAALAPTLEAGPLNLNEITYLEGLYRAQAKRWFDIVAAQPYGFDSDPTDPAQAGALNFRRIEQLRRVMIAHDDAATPVWATAFGWNALPQDWSGRPSPWKSDLPRVQAHRTAVAIDLARREWPWLGPMLAIRWDATGLAADDPARGFALLETPPLLTVVQTAATASRAATPGRYPAAHPSGRYSPGWRFAGPYADIPRREPRILTIPFEGRRLDLAITRGPYRAYLWVTIDGQPANALPQDKQGRSYVVLYDPLRASDTVTLAQNLSPGRHEAVIEAEGGWGQWALEGWTVHYHPDRTGSAQTGLAVAGLFAVLSGLGGLWQILPAFPALAKTIGAWSERGIARYTATLRGPGQIILTFGLALGLYLAPERLALLLLPALALTILLRPDLGLALLAFSLSFFQAPKQFPGAAFSPVELLLLLTLLGFIFRGLLAVARTALAASPAHRPRPPTLAGDRRSESGIREKAASSIPARLSRPFSRLQASDVAALTLVILALFAALTAANFGVSLREWRVVVLEPVIFYFLVRLGLDFGPPERPHPPSWRWAWRLIDAFVAGAALQALIALYLYVFTDQTITAEGVRRALGFAYGSPNNLSLFLGRAWPLLLAISLLSGEKLRRRLYAVGFLIVSLALYLTFSKGALLVGLPACIIVMAWLYVWSSRRSDWRRILALTGGGLFLLTLALIPLSRTERFRSAFDFEPGSTGFFRLKLWQASLTMLGDHWPLGVGLDNFLYQYRTRYILPEAWQEPNLSHPHNLILDFGTRVGLGGVLLLIWLQIAFWRNAWRLYQATFSPLILGLMGSMVVFLSHGLVDNSYFLVDLAFVFFLTMGVTQRLAEQTG